MLRDFKLSRRKDEEIENHQRDSFVSQSQSQSQASIDSSLSRPPLHTIHDPNPVSSKQSTIHGKTPTKPKNKTTDHSMLPNRTPDEKHGSKMRFGWRNDPASNPTEDFNLGQGYRGTPKSCKALTMGSRAGYSYSESNSTQSTPTKSVSKPPNSAFRNNNKVDANSNARVGSFAALSKGMPSSCGPTMATISNTVEVPHFDLKEDVSFWMDHNVQVLIRARPPNTMEKSMHGYKRCLNQENAQSITWIGQPETRFTFDHVACETVDQEMLFKMACRPMVENCLSGYNSCMFAYGQTGSGKTYTMLGEIDDANVKPNPHRGMIPRIFEFLFARIQAEEESRRDEKLKYNCKCSFLEIYNEQITDLLDPAYANLQLREDVKKGVYVENLTEFEVQSVTDVLRLLIQGSLNRKVAATNMNRESSRSHSVFTCVIESRWEKDSATNLRFARLNLVDLAGSERQKTSGAEGERLKEAASINKSLSTLGHVIMILVDIANGKPRHVPYRDSRLTFLLQDSLGGNSKTMIIANVSPSIGCATETLNTLKFAQRAKLIQNNAVVNEDSSGDVTALRHQIILLKEELAILKRQNISRSLSFASTMSDKIHVEENACTQNNFGTDQQRVDEFPRYESARISPKQLKSLEATLAGAMRREQMAETCIKKLEAEIKHLNHLVCQREEESKSSKMMLRFREDKIHRLESIVNGSLPLDSYLMEENKVLTQEIELLQSKVEKNPKVTQFALDNIRLINQVKRFEELYEEGEREILLAEISELREQLLKSLDRNSQQQESLTLNIEPQEAIRISQENDSLCSELKHTVNELEDCRRNLNDCLKENAKLSSEIQDLHSMLKNFNAASDNNNTKVKTSKDSSGVPPSLLLKHTEEIMNLELELDILKIILKEEKLTHSETEQRAACLDRELELARENMAALNKQCERTNNELKEAKLVIEALESQQILSIHDIEGLRHKNNLSAELLSEKEIEISALKEEISITKLNESSRSDHSESKDSSLQTKLKRMQHSLEKAKMLNMNYQSHCAFQTSSEEEMDEVRRQVEAETAEVIVCMQNELVLLQQEVEDCRAKEMETKNNIVCLETELNVVQEKLYLLTDDNNLLHGEVVEKEEKLRMLSEEWELLFSEIEHILEDGHESLIDASSEIDLITSCFPEKRIWISEQMSKLIRSLSEKDLLIEELGRCLEDANSKRGDMECMLKSLRGATLAINEAHQEQCNEKEKENFQMLLTIENLEDQIKIAEDRICKLSDCATVAFVIVNRVSEMNHDYRNEIEQNDFKLRELQEINQNRDDQALMMEEADKEICHLRSDLGDLEKTCAELEEKLSQEKHCASFLEEKLKDMEETHITSALEKVVELKTGVSSLRLCMNMSPDRESTEKQSILLQPDIEMNGRHQGSHSNDHISDTADSSSGDENTVHEVSGKDVTIILLRQEIESALESLKMVQAEMSKLHKEKEEFSLRKEKSEESMACLASQIISMQDAMNKFEIQHAIKVEAVDQKLLGFEQIVEETLSHWSQIKEILELEVGDAKIIAAQKSAEASCIFAKFDEAQNVIKDADIVINRLMLANENMKLDVGRLKQEKVTLTDENKMLVDENKMLVDENQSFHSINASKDHQIDDLEHQFDEMKDLVTDLEHIFTQTQINFDENFISVVQDFDFLKSLVFDSKKLIGSWIEEIWSDIIVKDCAMSVLHICHMGILLETVTGLNAENSLLQHGLCESTSTISDLREHNLKSRRELETCRVLQGKLLSDIKNSFNRISRKEEETQELAGKLITFENKVSDLLHQEEIMLQRSHSMGSQLDIFLKEMDSNNASFAESLMDREKLFEEKKDLILHADSLTTDLISKDVESRVLAFELEELTRQRAKENSCYQAVTENFKKELIFSIVDAELFNQFSLDRDMEIEHVQSQNNHLVIELNRCFSTISQLDAANKGLEQENNILNDVACSNEKLKSEFQQAVQKQVELENEIQALVAECQNLRQSLKETETELEVSSDHVSVVEEDNKKLQKVITLLEYSLRELELKSTYMAEEKKFLNCEVNGIKSELQSAKHEIESNLSHIDTSMEILYTKGINLFNKLEEEGFKFAGKMFEDLSESLAEQASFLEEFEYLTSETKMLIAENVSLQTELLRKDDIVKGLLFDLSLLQESASETKDHKDKIEEIMADLKGLEEDLAVKSCELDEALAHTEMIENQLQNNLEKISILEKDISKEREIVELLSSENSKLRVNYEASLAQKCSLEELLDEKTKMTEVSEMEISEMGNALGKMNDEIDSLRTNMNELDNERNQLHEEVLLLKQTLENADVRAAENEAIVREAQQIAESCKTYAEEKDAEVKLLERSVEELEFTVNVLENKVDIIKGEAERQRLQREEMEAELHAVNQQMQNLKNSDADMKRHLEKREKDLHQSSKNIQILQMDVADKEVESFNVSASSIILQQVNKLKAHISELNLHAEAQASEYKQKFKVLEAMAEQVRPEGHFSHSANSSPSKLVKNAVKSRGSGSPFKCIGLGLAHQIKSEHDEELIAARSRIVELESLAVARQKEMENMNHKKTMIKLEGEMKNLSGQQNLQQRINHHAKIKEENNILKYQNKDLSDKLQRSELICSRVKKEIAKHLDSKGRSSSNFDEYLQMSLKLKGTEAEKLQLAQNLLHLCTTILKVSGMAAPVSSIGPDVAEEALERIKNKIDSLQRDNTKLKNRLTGKRAQGSPVSRRSDEKFQSPRRLSGAPYFSTLDR
ncbi:hypothetical protein ACFE04_021640 [Oxalis oulophora]